MSGISIFGISERKISLDLKLKVIDQLKLKFKTVKINEDDEIEIYVEEEYRIYGKEYSIRDDFIVVIDDLDFLLNYPEFEDESSFDQSNRNSNFSVSTMVSNLGTTYVLLEILNLFLTLINGVVVLNLLPSNYLCKFESKIKVINRSNGKVMFILSKENLQDLMSQEEEPIIN